MMCLRVIKIIFRNALNIFTYFVEICFNDSKCGYVYRNYNLNGKEDCREANELIVEVRLCYRFIQLTVKGRENCV